MSASSTTGIRIGVSAFAWTRNFGPGFYRVLSSLREHGLTAFEVPMFDPRQVEALQLRRIFEKQELECTVCAILPSAMNPISPDAKVREDALDYLAICIRCAAEMGAKLLCGPVYASTGSPILGPGHAREWEWAVAFFQRLGGALDAHEVDLAIEPVNRSETLFLRKTSEAARLCEEVQHPRIGITLDTFHANIEEKDLSGAVQHCAGYLKHVHVSENDRGRLGSGHVDFKGLVSELRSTGYNGYLMIEGFGYAPGVKDSLAAELGMADGSPEEIAFGGAQFLHQLLHCPTM
jgi:D-psicose/D-tagatose/L-ribulose 3-epimerase